MRVWLIAAIAVLPASQAMARSADPDPNRTAFETCVSDRSGDDLLSCQGIAAEPCMRPEAQGETTFGMVRCHAMEAALWEDELNALLIEGARPSGCPSRSVDLRQSLDDAQRAWVAFRNGECHLERALWGAGSMRSLAAALCIRDTTARRVARLSQSQEDGF